MSLLLVGTQWKIQYDLPYSDPIIFKFIDDSSVRTNSGTKFNWRYLSAHKIEIYIQDYVSLVGNIVNETLIGGVAYSDYSGLDWKWTCKRFVPNPEPIVGHINKSELINGKWTIFNSIELANNEITFEENGILSSNLYGTGTWTIKNDELIISTAQKFIIYRFQILDNEWCGKARNEMGYEWKADFKHTFIIPLKQTTQYSERDLWYLYNQRKRDCDLISKYLKEIGITCFYHFTDRSNIDSIKFNGGLFSWYYCMENNISITKPGGDQVSRNGDIKYNLQDYVRLSFCKKHPMQYICVKDGRIQHPVILEISIEVAELETTLFSDINAVDKNHKIGGDLSFLRKINHSLFSKDYRDLSISEKKEFQAEVLIKTWIPIKFIKNI